MLENLSGMLAEAKQKKYAIGAFNTTTFESLRAVISAAEECQTPVIIQHAQSHDGIIALEEIGPLMLEHAKKAKVPVAVHLDHGATFERCVQAIRLGFTSVMYDASGKDFETNVRETQEIVKIAHAAGVTVEAELGSIFSSEVGNSEGDCLTVTDDEAQLADIYTDPQAAKEFVERTGVDCLAIAFGTVHGIYVKEPRLDLERITKIKQAIDLPFVMHGGSGVSAADYHQAIQNGICKINYYTYMNQAGGEEIRRFVQETPATEPMFYDTITKKAQAATKADVIQAMRIFKGDSL